MPALTPLSSTSTESIQPIQNLSFNALLSRLVDIIGESTWNCRSISHTLFKLHRELNQEATKNQATSLRSWMPTSLKTLSCAMKVIEIATYFPQTGCVLSSITGKCLSADELTKLFERVLQPAEGFADVGASFWESHGAADRTEESSRGDSSRSESEFAARKKSEADAEFNDMLRMVSSIGDARRAAESVIASMRQ